jgi:predicted nucleic acid-binding Zn ribbon protein
MIDQKILDFDPFEGDFGTPGDKVFTNRMVTARKPGPCSHCEAEISKGERVRRQVSKFDGELMTHRWCALCCKAMADYEDQSCDENRDTLPDYECRRNQAAEAAIKENT